MTLHGKDLGGHRVAPVSGYVSVWCANFADAETDRNRRLNQGDKEHEKNTYSY